MTSMTDGKGAPMPVRAAEAKHGPGFVEKTGQINIEIVSVPHCLALQMSHDKASRAARKMALEAAFGDWLAAENTHFET
jgi:hypothetical protein